MNQDSLSITKKFGLVEYELNLISAKIHLKKGSWVLMQHVYTTDQLRDSEHFRRIHAICEKIGDDVLNWCRNGKLSEEGARTYKMERQKVDRNLAVLQKEILERDRTAMDDLAYFLNVFWQVIMKVLPVIETLLRIGAAFQGLKLPGNPVGNQKLLP